jgi:hypothetical protein
LINFLRLLSNLSFWVGDDESGCTKIFKKIFIQLLRYWFGIKIKFQKTEIYIFDLPEGVIEIQRSTNRGCFARSTCLRCPKPFRARAGRQLPKLGPQQPSCCKPRTERK